MLLFIGLFLVFILGYALVNCISPSFSLPEKLGLSIPLGLTIETILMTFLDLIGVPLTAFSVLLAGFITLLPLCFLVYRKRKEWTENAQTRISAFSWKQYNLVWLLFIALIAYVEYMNLTKTLYLPAFERDALTAFDTMGFVFAQEHTMKAASIFNADYVLDIRSHGSPITYTPFVQLSYTFVYLLGASTSKLIPALMFLSFLIGFYGISSRVAGRTAAAIATLFMALTPEMLAFSSMSITNVMHAVFASLAVIYMSVWFRERKTKDLILCGVLLGANVWCRTEGIVFIGAVGLLLLIDLIRRKEYKNLIWVALLAFLPIIFWSLFMKINNMYSESIAITKPYWDAEKMGTIWEYLWALIKNTTFYGYTFYVLLIAFLTNLWFLIKKKDNMYLLIGLVLSFVFYIIILYQIDYVWDKITNVLSYSAKRFMFCFVPIVWYYAFSNGATQWITKKLEQFLSLKQPEK